MTIQDDDLEATRRRLSNAMRIGQVENPDALAVDRRQAETLGVSVGALRMARQQGVALPNPETDLAELPRTAPRTAGFLSTPANAALAHDAVPELSEMERVIAAGPFAGQRLQPGYVAPGPANILRGLASSFLNTGRQVRESLSMQLGDALGIENSMDRRDFEQALASQELRRPTIEDPTRRAIYGGFESFVNTAGVTAAAVITRNPTLPLALGAAQAEALAYPKYRLRGATAGEALLGAGGSPNAAR